MRTGRISTLQAVILSDNNKKCSTLFKKLIYPDIFFLDNLALSLFDWYGLLLQELPLTKGRNMFFCLFIDVDLIMYLLYKKKVINDILISHFLYDFHLCFQFYTQLPVCFSLNFSYDV